VPGLACLKRHWAALMCISKTIDCLTVTG
jgi:hypothetical protein